MTADSLIFILSLFMTAFVTFDSLRKVLGIKNAFLEKYDDKLDLSAIIITIITFAFGIADAVSESFLGLSGYYINLTIYMAGNLFLVSLFENCCKDNRNTSFISFAIKTFTVVMLAELFVFNFNSYHMIFGNYPQKVISEYYDSESEVTTTNDTTYYFSGIDIPVGTLTVDADISGTNSEFMFKIGVSDETSGALRKDAGKLWAVPGYPETYTAPMHFSGTVKKLTVKTFLPKGQSAVINSLIINKPIAVRLSIIRLIVFMGVPFLSYIIINSRKMISPVSEDIRFFRAGVNVAVVCAMIALTVLCVTNRSYDNGLYELFHLEKGDQLTQDLVDAFESGHTYMTFEPGDEILDMENPYDSVMRDKIGLVMNVDYAWDHLLYNGKYYSYYGIAPVVLLFMPYHLMTGYYFPTPIAVYIFSMAGVFALSRLYIAFVERWFPDLPKGMSFLGIIVMLSSCGIWFSTARPEFYEIAISAGFACVCSGMYFLITSNILSNGDIALKRLAFSSVMLSLGVMSRPTTAVYCICAVVFIIMGYGKAEKQLGDKKIKYFVFSLLPYAVIGSIQMAYNYVRFGSPFDFGIQYSLTVNDFTNSQYHTRFVAVTVFNFIFNMPAFVPEFPFISSKFHDLNANGYYYQDSCWINAIATGLLYRAMPVMAYVFSRKSYRLSENPYKKRYVAVILLLSFIAPSAILFSIWESGYTPRYMADFSWEILIGALCVIFVLIIKYKNEEVRKIIKYGFMISVFLSFAVNFGQVYSFIMAKSVSYDYTSYYCIFARQFEFWK